MNKERFLSELKRALGRMSEEDLAFETLMGVPMDNVQ